MRLPCRSALRGPVVLVASLVLALPVRAVVDPEVVHEGADFQRFQPYSVPQGGYAAGASEILDPRHWGVGLSLNYARNPLVFLEDGVRTSSTVRNNLTAHLQGSVGILSWLSLELGLPLVVYQDGTDPRLPNLTAHAVGDLRLQPRFRVLTQWKHGVALSVSPVLTMPLGASEALAGEPHVNFYPELGLSWRGKRLFVAGQLAFRFRNDVEVLAYTRLGQEATIRLAGGWAFNENWTAILEFNGGLALSTLDAGIRGNPLEGLLGLRRRVDDRWAFDLAAGTGLFSAPGTPDVRVIGGVTWGRGLTPPGVAACQRVQTAPSPAEPVRMSGLDQDADGLDDACDLCPADREEQNQIDDADGCPDDRDHDGVLDAVDACLDLAGQKPTGCPDRDGDGLLDRDDLCPDQPGAAPSGCPDLDGDGILDKDDQCPDVAEDRDGFEDLDGCPEADNDRDGLLDAADKCPNMPEDKDKFEDADGCPDPDNDLDGVLDAADKCPNEKETINGFQDEDGCPDSKGRILVVVKKDRIEILDKVYFDTDKDVIQKRSFGLLQQVALTVKAHPEIDRLRVEGHTDDIGGSVHNIDLSQRRAESVKRFLVKEGVAGERLVPKGFSFDRPLVPNKNNASRATNRRVEFRIIGDEEKQP